MMFLFDYVDDVQFPRDLTCPIASTYNPSEVEKGWSEWWEKKGFFSVNSESCANVLPSQKFIMVIPPPNVTGMLHLGHTLTVAIQDCLTRWSRMQGKLTLWIPGVDHAGIATQSVVERHLFATQGLTRHELGREKFLQCTYEWKEKYGNQICSQLRRLGVSVDWTREAFTMSEAFTHAVQEAFIRLYEAKLIYRDIRLVSWCSYLKTALSDIEVDTKEITKPERLRVPGYDKTVEVGVMWHFKYLLKEDNKQWITVATTRIETLLGDVAVAVHENDSRYRKLIGKELLHPFFPERNLRIIGDSYVDPSFGTGAVKITPAHDKNDYLIGQRHGLPLISIFTPDGYISEAGGEFCGLHRFECRNVIEKKLVALGLLVKKEPVTKPMALPLCSRSNDIVEYLLIPQWWMNCKDVAKEAVNAVHNGELRIVPDYYKPTWFHWLDNIKDWCISRQLWWGHRIPAYQVFDQDKESVEEVWVVGRNKEEARDNATKKLGHSKFHLEQDPDVLDTWFSSALFPFAVFSWPEKTKALQNFFPTTLLETGHDILFFWVARMVMMSLLLLKRLPFRTVLLHAMVRDSHGRKMSKSLGNVVNPVDVIEGITLKAMSDALGSKYLSEKECSRAKEAQKKDFPKGIPECGTDALRYGLLAYTSQGRSINLDVNRIVGYRFFCNKLWNATKFALAYFLDFDLFAGKKSEPSITANLAWPEQWILHRLSRCCHETNAALEHFDFAKAVTCTYSFWLYELCDIYLEVIKPRLAKNLAVSSQEKTKILTVLFTCFDRGLRLLHPMLPYVTEELYQRLWFCQKCFQPYPSICIAPYPLRTLSWENSRFDEEMESLMTVVKQFRSLLVQLQITSKDKLLEGYVRLLPVLNDLGVTPTWYSVRFFEDQKNNIATLAKLTKVHIINAQDFAHCDSRTFPKGCISNVISNKIEIAVDPNFEVDLKRVYDMLEKKLNMTRKSLDGYSKKFQLPCYAEKVPEDIRLQNEEKIKQLQHETNSIQDIQSSLLSIMQHQS